MSTTYTGINYWPMNVSFFETDAIELVEAQYGIKSDTAISKLVCKIFKEGYYIPWGEEQSMIFARKLGGEVSAKEMNGIIEILINKGFFDKESFEKHQILTSSEIQRIWMEATSRRKRNVQSLPYLIVDVNKGKESESDADNVDNLPTQGELYLENENNFTENDDISRQSRVEHSKAQQSTAGKEEDNAASPSFEIPEYANNMQTHNVEGLLESLRQHKVTNRKEIIAILRLSDYGRKETQIWITLSTTNWAKIASPGKYIIATLKP